MFAIHTNLHTFNSIVYENCQNTKTNKKQKISLFKISDKKKKSGTMGRTSKKSSGKSQAGDRSFTEAS